MKKKRFCNELKSYFEGTASENLRTNYFIFVFNANFHGLKCSKWKKQCHCNCILVGRFRSLSLHMCLQCIECATLCHTRASVARNINLENKKRQESMAGVLVCATCVRINNVCYRSKASISVGLLFSPHPLIIVIKELIALNHNKLSYGLKPYSYPAQTFLPFSVLNYVEGK